MSDTFLSKEMKSDAIVQADAIRQKADELLSLFDNAVSKEERSEASRLMSLARTSLEQSAMWAIKAISRK